MDVLGHVFFPHNRNLSLMLRSSISIHLIADVARKMR